MLLAPFFKLFDDEGLQVSFKKTTWIASSSAVQAALQKQSQGEPVQVSSVAKDSGIANAAGRARRTQVQTKRLQKGITRGTKLHNLKVQKTSHRVRVSKMGSLSAAIWGHQGLGLSPKQMRGIRTQAALAARRCKLGSVDVVFSLGEGNCCDPLQTVVLQHWRTLYKLLFAQTMPTQYLRLWQITWEKLLKAPKRWALVKGPVAAMIAYLQDLGVKAQDPSSWQCPANSLQGPGLWSFPGDIISLVPGQTTRIHAEEGLRRLLQFWTNHRISQQDAGSGAERGVDWSVPRRLLKSQSKRPNHLTALRSVWQGAFCTTTKGAKRICPLCKKPANIRHVLLECRWWSGRGPAPLHTGKSCKQPGRHNLFGCAVCRRPPTPPARSGPRELSSLFLQVRRASTALMPPTWSSAPMPPAPPTTPARVLWLLRWWPVLLKAGS